MSALAQAVAVHKALGHPVRQRLLAMLEGGELCVCQMTAVLDLAASTVSAHLAELKRAGLLAEDKEGRWVRYRWAREREARRLIERLVRGITADPRVRADADVLKQLRRVDVEELCRVQLDLSRVGVRRRA